MADSTIPREMIKAGAPVHDLHLLRKVGWSGQRVDEARKHREHSEARERKLLIILNAALVTRSRL